MEILETIDQWEVLKKQSHEYPVIVFKHSNQCPISADINHQLEKARAEDVITDPIHRLIVQDSRAVSNAIAHDTGITHESPQLIIIKDGAAIYDADHHAIDPAVIIENL